MQPGPRKIDRRRKQCTQYRIVEGPLAPGAEIELTASMSKFPSDRDIVIYSVVDADKLINEGNNRDNASNPFRCGFDIR